MLPRLSRGAVRRRAMTPVNSASRSPATLSPSQSSYEAEGSSEVTPGTSASFVVPGDAAALRLPAFLMTPRPIAEGSTAVNIAAPVAACYVCSCVVADNNMKPT